MLGNQLEQTFTEESGGSVRKVWSMIQLAPCVHKEMHVWVLQEHIGSWSVKNGKDVYTACDEPFQRRGVYMVMDRNGKLSNVFSAYDGPQRYK